MKEKLIFLSLLFCVPLMLSAQICTGSLGDPVINVTFGTGPNPGSPLPQRITSYYYTSSPCPGDGFYSIVNTNLDCFSSTWHNLTEDHTPNDVNGYMMVVNGSYQPGDFYVDTLNGLCANTTYEFAAWVLNILKSSSCSFNGIKPNLTFSIETNTGTLLGKYSTGDIDHTSSPVWKQYGLFFTTPRGLSSIVLRLTNNAIGGCGNDIVLDDITFRPCGPLIDASINISTGNTFSLDLCEGDTKAITMSASLTNGYSKPIFQWQVSRDSLNFTDIGGAITPSYIRSATGPGNYYYRLSVVESDNVAAPTCRVFSKVLTIRINSNPSTQISVNEPVCVEGALQLHASGGTGYAWAGPDGFTSALQNPQTVASDKSAGKYYVTVSSPAGCQSKDSITLNVLPKAFVNAGIDQTICEGNSVLLNATESSSYLWSPSNGLSSISVRNPIARPADSTVYSVMVKDVNGCSSSDSVSINVLKNPVAVTLPEVQLFEGQSVNLKGSIKGSDVQFFWTPVNYMTNSTSLTPTVTPPDNIVYTLHVISNQGCGIAQADVRVKVYKKVIIPNAFSPNGDGINDVWNIEALQTYSECTLSVFNRYGTEVFTSRGYNKKWDGTLNGKPLPFGTYYYTLDLKVGKPVMTGWVLIVR